MEDVIQNAAICYYTDLLMFICTWICLITGIKNNWKFRQLRILPLYPMASIIQVVLLYVVIFYGLSDQVIEASISLFILIEFLVIYHLMFQIIVVPKFQKILYLMFYSFILFLLYMWIFSDAFFQRTNKLFLAQTLCMLVPTFLYYVQLFILTPRLQLKNNPEFWIVTGYLFYFSCTIPLFLIGSLFSINKYYFLYSVNFIAYSILYLLITRAFLCKKVQPN